MSTYHPPHGYSSRSSSGSDFHFSLPRDSPELGSQIRGAMDYKESIFEGIPANYEYTSERSSTCRSCSCGSEEGDDDVFYKDNEPYRKAAPFYPSSIIYPRSPDDSRNSGSRGLSTESMECCIQMSDDSTDESAYASRFATSSYRSDHVPRTTLPSWPDTLSPVKPTTRRSPDDSRNSGSRGLSTESMECCIQISDDSTDDPAYASRSSTSSDHVPRTTLPSWPDTLSPVKPTTRQSRDDSRNSGSRGLPTESMECCIQISDDSTDDPAYASRSSTSSYYSDHVPRTTLPSWPDTPSPVKPTTRQSPYLRPYNIHNPPWDMDTRHSEGTYRPSPPRFRDTSF
ncbi:hypothetical protein BsWGS_17019 [Bradybaena similaris]